MVDGRAFLHLGAMEPFERLCGVPEIFMRLGQRVADAEGVVGVGPGRFERRLEIGHKVFCFGLARDLDD